MFCETFKGDSRDVQGHLKSVSIMFHWSFVFAWISSQLPEQKEGLFLSRVHMV